MTNFWQTLNKPFTVLAPMDDVTDVVFRELITTTAKPDVLFTEFTSTDGLASKGRDKVATKLRATQNQRPIVAQIWGAKPENFVTAAKYIESLGFDGIDINMGCPVTGVMKKKSGAALIGNNKLVTQLIDAVHQGAPNLPVSVKTRLGTDQDATKEWLSFLLSLDISALTLHAREAKVNSKGAANWDEIGKAVELRNKLNPAIVLIGNGDVSSYKEVLEKHKTYNVDGVMIGRGVFHNPWVFEKSATETTHSEQEYLRLLLQHTGLFHTYWGETKNFEALRKYFKIYVKGFRGADDTRIRLMATKKYEDIDPIIRPLMQ